MSDSDKSKSEKRKSRHIHRPSPRLGGHLPEEKPMPKQQSPAGKFPPDLLRHIEPGGETDMNAIINLYRGEY